MIGVKKDRQTVKKFFHIYIKGKALLFKNQGEHEIFIKFVGDILTTQRVNNKYIGDHLAICVYSLTEGSAHFMGYATDNLFVESFVKALTEDNGVLLATQIDEFKLASIDPEDLVARSYILHRQPKGWTDWPYSSLRAYLYADQPDWLDTSTIKSIVGSAKEYYNNLESDFSQHQTANTN